MGTVGEQIILAGITSTGKVVPFLVDTSGNLIMA